MLSELLILAQLTTNQPQASQTPAYSWEQSKLVQPPDFKLPTQSGHSSSKQVEEFEHEIFNNPN